MNFISWADVIKVKMKNNFCPCPSTAHVCVDLFLHYLPRPIVSAWVETLTPTLMSFLPVAEPATKLDAEPVETLRMVTSTG